MNTDSLRFKKYLKFRVEPKRCPTHNKSAHISVTRMEYKITNCCCSEFESFLSDLCEKYRVGILLGKYKNTPKETLTTTSSKSSVECFSDNSCNFCITSSKDLHL